ncbi:MAG: hypothetical protein R3C60_00030 [Parvularculaceae bacterium]
MRVFIFTIFAAFFAGVGAAEADYKSEYKEYMAAYSAGDIEGALAHGEKAWRAAEEEIGATATTAILAYNFGRLAAATTPSTAEEAFERALEITNSGEGSLLIPDLELRIATMRNKIKPTNETRKTLAEKVAAQKAADPAATDATVAALSDLASYAASRGPEAGTNDADAYLNEAERLEPRANNILANALTLAGAVRIAGRRRTATDIAEAVVLLDRAIALFPPQKDIEHFDPGLASALVWRSTLDVVIESFLGKPVFKLGSRIAASEDLRAAYERAQESYSPPDSVWDSFRPESCENLEWAERKPPTYPKDAIHKGAIGAAIVGYDVDDTHIVRAVPLGEIYNSGFAAAAVKSMSSWKLKTPPPPECRKNALTFFNFIMR